MRAWFTSWAGENRANYTNEACKTASLHSPVLQWHLVFRSKSMENAQSNLDIEIAVRTVANNWLTGVLLSDFLVNLAALRTEFNQGQNDIVRQFMPLVGHAL